VSAKPADSLCNLARRYCYCLKTEDLYPQRGSLRVSGDFLAKYIVHHIDGLWYDSWRCDLACSSGPWATGRSGSSVWTALCHLTLVAPQNERNELGVRMNRRHFFQAMTAVATGTMPGSWTRVPLFLIVLSCSVSAADGVSTLEVRRFAQNPIIRPEMLPGRDGANVNGPSLIRMPAWAPNRLGNYYLYFAHHNGKYIRLAYADRLEGPWKIHEPGALKLSEAPGCTGHIASPDVHVDETRQEIRMYFHGPAQGGQKSFVAVSKDGLHFKASPEVLGLFYFRVFHGRDGWYAMAKGGLLYRSKVGLTGFELGPNPFPGSETRGPEYNKPGPRHVALHQTGNVLWVYYSNIGDEPERILRCSIRLADDWRNWKASAPEEVLRPQTPWEGADLPLRKSVAGAMQGSENALRDPAVFTDADGRAYLLYSVAGESGIAIAELIGHDSPRRSGSPVPVQQEREAATVGMGGVIAQAPACDRRYP